MKSMRETDTGTPDKTQLEDSHNERKTPAPNTTSQQGAMLLAKRLERYWHKRGYPAARFWVEPIGERFAKVGTYELYRVACNLVKGLPPRYRDEPYA